MLVENYTITDFSPHLFWDMKPGSADLVKHQRLIVERVIQRGSRKDLDLLQMVYNRETIRTIIRQIAWLNEKDMVFVHVYFDIPFLEMKCYTKRQSARYC